MGRRIVIVQGHPDRAETHLGHALAAAYARGARTSGREVRRVDVALLEFPLLRTTEEWNGPMPEALRDAQASIGWADHLVLLFPLWNGTMPALVKGFWEQVARPGHAFRAEAGGRMVPAWRGKSARVVVTMGMPAFWFRLAHGAFGVRGLRRSILMFCGMKPVRTTLIGGVGGERFAAEKWLARLEACGRDGV